MHHKHRAARYSMHYNHWAASWLLRKLYLRQFCELTFEKALLNAPIAFSSLTINSQLTNTSYGVATISRMLKNIGLFCKRALQKRPVFCKETCIFKHPTNRSHPIVNIGELTFEKALLNAPIALHNWVVSYSMHHKHWAVSWRLTKLYLRDSFFKIFFFASSAVVHSSRISKLSQKFLFTT